MTALPEPPGLPATGEPDPGRLGLVAGTTPYPWPYDGGCAGERLALVAAGWDGGWRRRAAGPGAAGPHGVAAADAAVASLAVSVAAAGGAVLAVAHDGPPRLAFRPGDDGHDDDGGIGAGGPALAGATHLVAAGLDGFWGSGLDPVLRARGVTHLLVAGHGLEGPVHSLLRSANDRGYECLLVLDAASPLLPAPGPAAARSMVEMSGGIFGAVGATDAVLAALRLAAGHTPAAPVPTAEEAPP